MTRLRHVTADSAVVGLATAFAAVVAAVVTAVPANAKVFDKEHIHESFVSDPYDCEGISAVDSVDRDILITAVLRGSSPFPAFREHFAGTVITTNTATGGTFTDVFSLNNKDHKITDNGDGTITVTEDASGTARYYDQYGNFVLRDPGSLRFAFDLDYNGTPGNPDDDTEVPNSFRIIHGPAGNSTFAGTDLCADLRKFTTP